MRQKIATLCIVLAAVKCVATESLCQQPSWDEPTHYRGFTYTPILDDSVNLRDLEAAYREYGANMIRLHLRSGFIGERYGISDNYEAWMRVLEHVPALLDWAREKGVAIVLDLQDSPCDSGRRSRLAKGLKDRELSHAIWEDPGFEEDFHRFWKPLAEMCKDRTDQVIWFDVCNEPLDWLAPGWVPRRWPQIAQSTVDMIRSIDKVHPVVIQPGPGGIYNNFAKFEPIRDALPVIYSPHSYLQHNHTHQFVGSTKGTDLARLYKEKVRYPNYGDNPSSKPKFSREELEATFQCVLAFQRKHKVRIWVGEWSCVKWAPDVEQYFTDNIELFEKFGWDWCFHSWREFPGWSLDYAETLENVKTKDSSRAAIIRKWMRGGFRPRGASRRYAGSCEGASVVDYRGRTDFTEQPKPGRTWEGVVQYPILQADETRWNQVAWGPSQISAELDDLLAKHGKGAVVRFSCSGYAPNARGYVRDMIRICEEKGIDWCCARTEPMGWCDDILKEAGVK